MKIQKGLESSYNDVYTPEVLAALSSLSTFNEAQKAVMDKRNKTTNVQSGLKRACFLTVFFKFVAYL